MAEKIQRKSRIPQFKSREKEADFWDTHDSTEFEDEFRKAKLEFVSPLIHVLEVEFDGQTLVRLFEAARALTVTPNELAAKWVAERLEKQEARSIKEP